MANQHDDIPISNAPHVQLRIVDLELPSVPIDPPPAIGQRNRASGFLVEVPLHCEGRVALFL